MKPAAIGYSLLAGLLGILLVAGLFMLTGISFAQFGALASHIKFWPFAGIVVCSFLYVIFGAIKWRLITGMPGPRKFFYTYYTAQAMLIGQFLPPPVAIAVSRAAVMKVRQNVTLRKGLLNALFDMGFDFLIAGLLIPVSLLQLFYHFDFRIWLGMSILILLAASLLFMHAPKVLLAIWRPKLEWPEDKKRGWFSPHIIGFMMMLSIARFALVVVRLILGARAAHAAIPLAIIAYATPPATLPSLLALTPANLGIAEWSWAYLPTLWGIPAATGAIYAVSFRILVLAAQLLISAIAWLLYKTGNRH